MFSFWRSLAVPTSSFLSLRFVLASVFCLYSYRKDCSCSLRGPCYHRICFHWNDSQSSYWLQHCRARLLEGCTSAPSGSAGLKGWQFPFRVFLLIKLWTLGIVRTVVFCRAVKFLGHSFQTGEKFKYWWFQHCFFVQHAMFCMYVIFWIGLRFE